MIAGSNNLLCEFTPRVMVFNVAGNRISCKGFLLPAGGLTG